MAPGFCNAWFSRTFTRTNSTGAGKHQRTAARPGRYSGQSTTNAKSEGYPAAPPDQSHLSKFHASLWTACLESELCGDRDIVLVRLGAFRTGTMYQVSTGIK